MNRRTILKTTAAAVSSVGLISGITGANQKKATPHSKEERIQRFSEAPYDVTITTVSEEIKSNFGWTWWLLTVDGHKIDNHIENSNIYESKKEEYKNKLRDIRSDYKVEKVQKSCRVSSI